MKKYRLIELGDNYPQKLETYATFDEAATAMRNLMAGNRNNFYRIEEVEESIMDRVKSYKDACEVLDLSPIFNRQNLCICEHYEKTGANSFRADLDSHIIAILKLERITKALNEGWKPDWEDDKQNKWIPIFRQDGAFIGAAPCSGGSQFPSRLYFKSRDLAKYAGKQFADLYKQLLVEKF